MQIRYRALHPDDATLTPGSAFALTADAPTAPDPGVATGSFAAEHVLVLLLPDGVNADPLPTGTPLEVVGRRSMMHHLPSAVDIEISAMAVRHAEIAAGEAEEAFSQAMRRISLALAAGAEGVHVPHQFAGKVHP